MSHGCARAHLGWTVSGVGRRYPARCNRAAQTALPGGDSRQASNRRSGLEDQRRWCSWRALERTRGRQREDGRRLLRHAALLLRPLPARAGAGGCAAGTAAAAAAASVRGWVGSRFACRCRCRCCCCRCCCRSPMGACRVHRASDTLSCKGLALSCDRTARRVVVWASAVICRHCDGGGGRARQACCSSAGRAHHLVLVRRVGSAALRVQEAASHCSSQHTLHGQGDGQQQRSKDLKTPHRP
jgi:hypothetical protein